MTLEELAARVEALDRTSREVDCLIAAAIDLRPEDGHQSAAETLQIFGIRDFVRLSETRQNMWSHWVPRYTASLDAAMTLAPEDFKVHEFEQQSAHNWRWRCWLLRPSDAEGVGHAGTAALAMTAAALRALSRTTEQGEG